ncbi:cytochrome P450 oxidoreductase/alkane hydroxylase [Apiospora kogelbergensis]|uniref:Cytochrome P450 oxidoreductase/alkane hydroxylase n=1 Tax=Apiospora kogelbergensis TaxID=1337665 RepID=A0AAW0R2B2_9PEZI
MYLTTLSQVCLALLFSHLSITYLLHQAKRWRSAQQVRASRQCKAGKTERPWDVLGLRKIAASVRAVVRENPAEYLDTLWADHGDTYVARFLGVRVAFTRDAANLRHILHTRWLDFDAGRSIREHMMRDISPRSIAVADGAAWREKRNVWRLQFSRLPGLFHMPSQDAHFRRLLARIPAGGGQVDVQALLVDMATDVLQEAVTGDCPDCQVPHRQSERQRRFVQAAARVQRNVAWLGNLGPLYQYLPQGSWKADVAVYKAYMDAIITRKFQEIAKTTSPDPQVGDDGNEVRRSILDGLVRYTDDPLEIRDAMITVSFSNDSLAGIMAATVWFLSRHADVYAELRRSVLDTVGYEEPTYQQIGGFPYLQQVVNEALRLLPPIPVNARIANKNTWLPTGGGPEGKDSLLIKKGQPLVLSTWGAHRHPDVFGDDAEEFRPGRWDELPIDTPGYLPFLIGPRTCSGQTYVQRQSTYTLVRLVQSFVRIESRDDRPYAPRTRLALSNRNGMWMSMTPDPLAKTVEGF